MVKTAAQFYTWHRVDETHDNGIFFFGGKTISLIEQLFFINFDMSFWYI